MAPDHSSVSAPAKRGRKRNDALPPNRARDVQRAFRARRAAHLEALERRVMELEEENASLRRALGLKAHDQLPLEDGGGGGPSVSSAGGASLNTPAVLSPAPQWAPLGMHRPSVAAHARPSSDSSVASAGSHLFSYSPPVTPKLASASPNVPTSSAQLQQRLSSAPYSEANRPATSGGYAAPFSSRAQLTYPVYSQAQLLYPATSAVGTSSAFAESRATSSEILSDLVLRSGLAANGPPLLRQYGPGAYPSTPRAPNFTLGHRRAVTEAFAFSPAYSSAQTTSNSVPPSAPLLSSSFSSSNDLPIRNSHTTFASSTSSSHTNDGQPR